MVFDQSAVDITQCSFRATGLRAAHDTWPVAVNLQCGGSPAGGPSKVSIQDTAMYYRSAASGSVALRHNAF